ncbi:unnamed protein product [Coregonus sp. 'balchen']|nr:unnamed protein product [Coregonus sp. 'balchen']
MFAQWWCRDVLSKTKPSFLRFHTTSMRSISQQVRVRLLPSPRCFFDEPVHVKVDGLSPHQKVGLRSKLRDDKGIIFRASALYSADSKGQVDLCLSPSLGGSYTGVEPMGLFWAMTPETPHSRLLKKNVLGSIMVDVDALHEDTGEILASKTNERQFMTEGMRRIPLGLKNGRIRGTLFLPPGISEVRASLLANKGFVVLALGYYGFQDLPKTMSKSLDLEYFEEAITFLRRQPQVATAWINGCNANVMIPLHYKDLVIPPLMPVLENITLTPSSLLNIRDTIPAQTTERNRGSVIPIERSGSRFLFAASEDDMNWNSCLFAQQAAAQLRHHGKENFEVVTYPRAGHFLEVPYMPHYPSGFHAVLGKVVVFGGEAKANHEAQLDLWRRVQEFFRTHLKDSSNTAQKAKARL